MVWHYHSEGRVYHDVVVQAADDADFIQGVRAYGSYVEKAGGELHRHSWYFYLSMLIWDHPARGFVWSEGLIVGLAAVGLVAALTRKSGKGNDLALLRFLGFFTAALTVWYAAIPYKAPWCALGFLHGMILIAGVDWWRIGAPDDADLAAGGCQSVPDDADADVVIATTDLQAELDKRLRGSYNKQGIYGLRPGVRMMVYVDERLWEAFLSQQAAPRPAPVEAGGSP